MPKQFRNILHGISLKITCFILQKYTTVELTKSSGKRMIDPMLNIEGKKKHLPRHHIELIAVVCITQERVLFCSARLKERTVFWSFAKRRFRSLWRFRRRKYIWKWKWFWLKPLTGLQPTRLKIPCSFSLKDQHGSFRHERSNNEHLAPGETPKTVRQSICQ